MIFQQKRKDSIFWLPVDCVCFLVNCEGVIEVGHGSEASMSFPEAFRKYKTACESGLMYMGKALIVAGPHINRLNNMTFDYVAFLFVRETSRSFGSPAAAKLALESLHEDATKLRIKEISIPYFHNYYRNSNRDELRAQMLKSLVVNEFEKDKKIDIYSFIHRARLRPSSAYL